MGEKKKIIFVNDQSPGDLLMLTAAIKNLHLSYPDEYITGISSPCPAIWEHNPYITELNPNDPDVTVIECKDYQLIHSSNDAAYHFIHCFTQFIEDKLNIEIRMADFKPDVYIGDEEKNWFSQIEELTGIKDDFWIIVSGIKYDFTCKLWPFDYYQQVVDYFRNKITFVQVGEREHLHCKLNNVIDLVGKTDLRQLIRLVYHSVGTLSPVTSVMHLSAGVPVPEGKGRPKNRAGVVVAGGREPSQWEKYPHHRFLETNGALDCCDNGGCWASRCTKVKDNDDKNTENLCLYPIPVVSSLPYPKDHIDGPLLVPKCMVMLEPRMAIDQIELYYTGGALSYGSSIPNNIPEKAKPFIRVKY